MEGSQKARHDIYLQLAPWVVLASSVLITACYTGQFATIKLLKAPLKYSGKVKNGVAQVQVPKGFPSADAIFVSHLGTLFSKVKELPFPRKTQAANEQVDIVAFDIKSTALAENGEAFDLIYYPFYRFLSEEFLFDAEGKVAAYIADCLRFILLRKGLSPTVSGSGNSRSVNTGTGIQIEMTGMNSLSKVEIYDQEARTSFDLDRMRIDIDQRMFPDAYCAGKSILDTNGQLKDIAVSLKEFSLTMEWSTDDQNV